MKNFITALASSLLVAVIVTSLYTLVFASSGPFALFFLSFLGMAAVALFNVRQSALRSGIAAAGQTPPASSGGNGSKGGASRESSSRGGRGRGRNERSAKPERKDTAKAASGNTSKAAASSGAAADKAPAEPAVIPDGPRETGTVKWFNRSKGFGFIIRDNGEEIFVHHRSIRNSDDTRRSNLRDGQPVNYIVADHSKGQQAEDVVGE